MTPPMTEYTQILSDFINTYNRYKLHSEQAKQLGEKIEMSKKDVILKLRDCLIRQSKNNNTAINTEKISAEIADSLKGYVDPSYVRAVLGPEFKDQSKVREQQKAKTVKPLLVTAEGQTVQQEDEGGRRPGESRAEQQKRERDDYLKNRAKKNVIKVSNKMKHVERKEQSQQQATTKTYTGPSIGPREETMEEEETSYFITITDTDIIDEIVLLRTQQNVMRIRLEVDAAERTVMGIRQKP